MVIRVEIPSGDTYACHMFTESKRGAGKSTIVESLAVCVSQHGQTALIVELDPQGTLKDWSNRREANQPRVIQTLPQSIGDVLLDAGYRGVDWVFIDTPGHHNPAAIAAAAYADLILIPCKILSKKDVDAILPTIAEAERAGKPTYVIMNQVPPNAPKLVRKRQLAIQEEYRIKVLSLCLSRRADFEYCDNNGLSAAEYNPQGAAAAEIEKLYVLVQTILRVNTPDEDTVEPTVPGISEPVQATVRETVQATATETAQATATGTAQATVTETAQTTATETAQATATETAHALATETAQATVIDTNIETTTLQPGTNQTFRTRMSEDTVETED